MLNEYKSNKKKEKYTYITDTLLNIAVSTDEKSVKKQ